MFSPPSQMARLGGESQALVTYASTTFAGTPRLW